MYIDKILVGFLIGFPIGMIAVGVLGYLMVIHEDKNKKENKKK